MATRTRRQLTKADREKSARGREAQTAAYKRLMEAHKEELQRYMIEERTKRGLAPSNTGPSKTQLEEQIRKAEERLAKKRDLLRMVS